MTPTDWSSKLGEAHSKAIRTGSALGGDRQHLQGSVQPGAESKQRWPLPRGGNGPVTSLIDPRRWTWSGNQVPDLELTLSSGVLGCDLLPEVAGRITD